jgi:DNA invertase Pin-like site-specific DNA recombinase
MGQPLRVLSLLRVSGNQQIDRTGLPRQTEAIAEICKRENLIVMKGDEYRYEGLSGASVDKFPKYMTMLDRLEDPALHGIVFSDVSRLFRPEFVDQFGISKPFRVHGKLMYYEDGVLDLRKDRDMRLFIELAMEAGAYRKRTLKNTQWGRRERRRQGDCKSDPLPEGVTFVPHPKIKDELVTGHFEYTPEAQRVKEAYQRVLAGQSLSQIARDLKFGRPGKPNPNVVRNLLRSRWWVGEKASLRQRVNYGLRDDGTMYGGYRLLRKEPIVVRAKFTCNNCPSLQKDIHFDPLVSHEDFNAVQRTLDSAHKTWTRRKADSETDGSPFLGQGVLFCQCGRKIYTKPNTKSGNLYYRCSSYNNRNVPCGASHLHQEAIDQQLRDYFRLLLNPSFVKLLHPVKTASVNQDIIQRQIAEMERVKVKQYGRIGRFQDEALLDRMIRDTESQLEALKKELTAKPVESPFDPRKQLQRLRGFGLLPLVEQKKVLRAIFRRIVIDHKGHITDLDFVASKTLHFRVAVRDGAMKHEVTAIVPPAVLAQIKARK